MSSKMHTPLFTVAICCYNEEAFVRDCLDSVASQSFDDWEAVIVNDGSTDGSLPILRNYAERDRRFIVVDNENRGIVLSRRCALRLARGDYIVFLDADDTLHVDALLDLALAVKENDIDLVQFRLSRDSCFMDDDQYAFSGTNLTWDCVNSIQELRKAVCQTNSLNNLCGKAIKRVLFDVDVSYEENAWVRNGEDLFQLIPILENARNAYLLNKTLYHYRMNPTSMSQETYSLYYESVRLVNMRLNSAARYWGEPYLSLSYIHNLKSVYGAVAQLGNKDYEYKTIRSSLNRIARDCFFIDAYKKAPKRLLGLKMSLVLKLVYRRCFSPVIIAFWVKKAN